jgi:hypothetical protein
VGCQATTYAPRGASRGTPLATQLTVTVWPSGRTGAQNVFTLSCPDGGGSLPGAAAACKKLAKLGAAAFAPAPVGTACTMIYGGDQVATVTGSLDGKSIDASFSKVDGCEIDRWNRLDFLFPMDAYTGM